MPVLCVQELHMLPLSLSNLMPTFSTLNWAGVSRRPSDAHVLNSEIGWCQQMAIWCPRSQLWNGLVSADGDLMPTFSTLNWAGVSRRQSDAHVFNSKLGWCQQTAFWCPRSQLWTGLVSADGILMPTFPTLNWAGVSRQRTSWFASSGRGLLAAPRQWVAESGPWNRPHYMCNYTKYCRRP